MRNRYLPRSRPLIFDQVLSYARRAAATAASTSASLADAIVAMCVSSAGEIVANARPCPSELAVDEQPVLVAQAQDRARLGRGGVFEEAHLYVRCSSRTSSQSIVT